MQGVRWKGFALVLLFFTLYLGTTIPSYFIEEITGQKFFLLDVCMGTLVTSWEHLASSQSSFFTGSGEKKNESSTGIPPRAASAAGYRRCFCSNSRIAPIASASLCRANL